MELLGLKYKLSTEKIDCLTIGGVGGLADNQPTDKYNQISVFWQKMSENCRQ